jgi:RNA polymerase sigma factor (TIGR02999 family)
MRSEWIREKPRQTLSPMVIESSRVGEPSVTELLIDWGRGDRSALDRLMPLVYDELREVARHQLRYEDRGHTLQATALINETYLRLVNQERAEWRNRAQFFAISAQLIRRILVDHARSRRSAKRGGAARHILLDTAIVAPGFDAVDILALDLALEGLAQLDAQQERIVELRFFTGLSIEETASVLDISPATVNRDWVTAKAWLFRRLQGPVEAAGIVT